MYYRVLDYGGWIGLHTGPENCIDQLIEKCTNCNLFGHTRFVNVDSDLVYGIPTNMALWAYLRELYKDRTVV